jgi:hypothetical protein
MQHINLYLPRFQPRRVLLSASVALILWAVLTACLLIALWTVQRRGPALAAELQAARQKEAANRDLLENLSKKATPPKEPSPLLQQEIARLEKKQSARQGVVRALGGDTDKLSSQQQQHFSGYLEALARQHVQGLWLIHVTISENGQHVGIRGKTLDGKLVPEYLQRLKGETIFSGTRFNTLQLSRAEDQADRMDFLLHTLVAPEQAAAQAESGNTAETLLSAGANKAAEFIGRQLPGSALIRRLHGGTDAPTLGDGRR